MSQENTVAQHYEKASLVERIEDALKIAGLDDALLGPKDLEPLDQFHSRGLDATIELAEKLNITPSMRVLDIGSGLGGPSRYLARTYGCVVDGIDLSQSFVEAATFLARRAGLENRVAYQCANALTLPFSSETFDIAWTQHVAMNISDRHTLYSEAFRILRPAGRLAIFDVVSTSNAPLHFPVPWATTPENSFLVTDTEMRELLQHQGFRVMDWVDSTHAGIAWFETLQSIQANPSASPGIGLNLVMGPGFRNMTTNLARNLSEGRAGLIQAVVEKP